jgi:hypothetical protein
MAGASPHRAFLARFSSLRVSRRPRKSTTRHYFPGNLGYEQYRERERLAGALRCRRSLALPVLLDTQTVSGSGKPRCSVHGRRQFPPNSPRFFSVFITVDSAFGLVPR